jgi:hypothetical protein
VTRTDQERFAIAIACARISLCDLVLGHSGESDDVSTWRTAVHEAGHAIVQLVDGVDFSDVVLYEGGGGELRTVDIEDRYEAAPHVVRIAGDLGGAVAEETVFGDVEPGGVEEDLRIALARARITDPEAASTNEGCLPLVLGQVVRVRAMLRRRRRALLALAHVLLRAREVDRRTCARVVRDAGACVRLRPRFSPIIGWDERCDCELVRGELRERDARAYSFPTKVFMSPMDPNR